LRHFLMKNDHQFIQTASGQTQGSLRMRGDFHSFDRSGEYAAQARPTVNPEWRQRARGSVAKM
jgi:hypothetical protein